MFMEKKRWIGNYFYIDVYRDMMWKTEKCKEKEKGRRKGEEKERKER